MAIELTGVVHGKSIELTQSPGLRDGQEVAVTIVPFAGSNGTSTPREPGDGIRQSAGGWSDDAEGLEAFLAWTRSQRKQGRVPIEP